MIAPLAPSLPPLGAGAHVMPRYYLYKDLSRIFCKQVIRHYRNRGATSVRGEALGTLTTPNDFYRAVFFKICNPNREKQ